MAYTDNMIFELDLTSNLAGVTTSGVPAYSVESVGGRDRNVMSTQNGQITVDNFAATYSSQRTSTDKATISFWFKSMHADDWIVADAFGTGGIFGLTLDGRFTSQIRLNPGFQPWNINHYSNDGISTNGLGMQGNPLSHNVWYYISLVYDQSIEQIDANTGLGTGEFGDIIGYIGFNGVVQKAASNVLQGWGGFGANGLDALTQVANLCFGAQSPGNRVFNGSLADVRVHGRELSVEEMTSAMNAIPGEVPGYSDWTFNGQLNNVMDFSSGYTDNGSNSYFFAKKQAAADGTSVSTTIYTATDITDFATYTEHLSVSTGISGSPTCIAYGNNGKILLGTTKGGLYEVSLNNAGVLISCTSLHEDPTQSSIVALEYGGISGEWIFSTESGLVKSIPVGGGAPTPRVDLNVEVGPGAIATDISEGLGGIAIISRESDLSCSTSLISSDWSVIKQGNDIEDVLRNREPTVITYDPGTGKWYGAGEDGVVVEVENINSWIK